MPRTQTRFITYRRKDTKKFVLTINPESGLPESICKQWRRAQANGIATLGSDGKVPYSQLPSVTGGGGVIFRTQTFTFQRLTIGLVSFPLWPGGNNPGIVIVKIRSTQGTIVENMNITQDNTWAADGALNNQTTPEQLAQHPTLVMAERYEEVTRTYIAGEGWCPYLLLSAL